MANLIELGRIAFSDSYKGLYGSQDRPVLTSVCAQESKKGNRVGIDGLKANDATVSDPKTSKSQKVASNLADLAAFQGTFTDITGSVKQRSWVSPSSIKATDLIREEEDILGSLDPQAPLMKQLVSRIWTQEDKLVVDAALGANVSREDDAGEESAVAFGGATVVGDGATGILTLNDLSNADAEFRTDYIADKKYIVLSPAMYAAFKNANRDKVMNIDYVKTQGVLVSGNVEEIEGFTIIVSPSLTGTMAFAFTAGGICYNTFADLKTSVDRLPDRNNQTLLQARSYVGAVRNDDEGVVWVNLA
jgi:hypothetical protein